MKQLVWPIESLIAVLPLCQTHVNLLLIVDMLSTKSDSYEEKAGVYFSGRAVAYATNFLATRLTFQS